MIKKVLFGMLGLLLVAGICFGQDASEQSADGTWGGGQPAVEEEAAPVSEEASNTADEIASTSIQAEQDAVPAAPTPKAFAEVDAGIQADLKKSLEELATLRNDIVAEKLPMSRELRTLEDKLIDVRDTHRDVTRKLDTGNLDLNNLRNEIKSRRDENNYLSNLLGEYIRNFETRLHISELHRYEDVMQTARLAVDSRDLEAADVYAAQVAVVDTSLERLSDMAGGTTFEGTAVGVDGLLHEGTFVLVGPVALFESEDGKNRGTAEQRIGSLEPTIIALSDSGLAKGIKDIATSGSGKMPFDPTMGNAHKMEETKETLWENIKKGGLTMVPILGLALAALSVAIYKWVELSRLETPSEEKVNVIMSAVAKEDHAAAAEAASAINGPAGDMLGAGIEHINEPRDLIEEVMFERVLSAKLKLEKMLPFVAITASAAPLLGLLGTVTGIINTFKLITVFGSGDVKSLSGGISEALVTTMWGLIVAIPALLLHAFLSRKARGMIDQMEKCGVSFINQLTKVANRKSDTAA